MQSFATSILSIALPFMQENFHVSLNWIGELVRLIIEGVGIVGVGIIVFTLILKAITLPFDIYQRISMRKQSLIMKNMKDDLEKLQQQYANDPKTYNAKMVELQKKNGYSMFGACLPMIVTLAILMIAIGGFQSYAQYGNLSMYNSMAKIYNQELRSYAVDGTDDLDVSAWEVGHSETVNGITYTLLADANNVEYVRVESETKDIYYEYNPVSETKVRNYFIDVDKLYTNQTDESVKTAIEAFLDEDGNIERACLAYVQDKGAVAAAEWFTDKDQNDPSFLWIKNVWNPDVSYVHPLREYKDFTNAISGTIILGEGEAEKEVKIADIFTEADYNLLTSHLEPLKTQANGYYILIVITIGLMVLQQFIAMRSQKDANKYQTADGQQGAMTQKVMMVMMPLIYAITGFTWTAAFSIYIAMSSIIGIFTTLICNFFINRMFAKKEEEAILQRYTRTAPKPRQNSKKK